MPRRRFEEEVQSSSKTEERANKRRRLSDPPSSEPNMPPTPVTHDSPLPKLTPFTEKDFAELSQNEYARYPSNAKKIGHAVIIQTPEGKKALQYDLLANKTKPGEKRAEELSYPELRPLEDIEQTIDYGSIHYRARTPDGTQMYAKRFNQGVVNDKGEEETFDIAYFSPSEKKDKPPFFGSSKTTPLWRTDLSKKAKKDLDKELSEIKTVYKGGEFDVDPPSVKERDKIKTRNPDQNTVMGNESARDAYEHFFETWIDELHPDMRALLKKAFSADTKDKFDINSYRPEWLHAQGFSLTPMNKNPQEKNNLGAAPKWANTRMMVLERIIRWFALNEPQALLKIKPKFEMLLDTELVNHIDFEVNLKIKERCVRLMQSIDPFLAYVVFPKASDLAQTAGITHSIFNEEQPTRIQTIKGVSRMFRKDAEGQSRSILTRSRAKQQGTQAVELPQTGQKREREEEIQTSTKRKKIEKPDQSVSSERKIDRVEEVRDSSEATKKQQMKTFLKEDGNDHSVVQIYSNYFNADYSFPWRDPEHLRCSGSGFIYNHLGRNYIVTNAHVVENTNFLEVRLANDRTEKYEAEVKCVSYQCDLALLDVKDEAFQALVKPTELGDMVSLQQKVLVAGFPMGGEELSLSKGIVSRIQCDTYSMSGQDLLMVQIDAAVNSGNSGGPVFSQNKVVGVAFQGYTAHAGLNYMIPMPIVKHFLTEAFSSKQYRGFPSLPFAYEELENKHEREDFNMGDKTGIHIKKIDNLSDCYQKLKEDDILLAIDGFPVSNEGTVDIPSIGKCIDFHHLTQIKYIDDSVTLTILRNDKDHQNYEIFDIEVLLDTILGDTEKVPVQEYDKTASYYFNSGLCFMPLSRNYLVDGGEELEEYFLVEEHCRMIDAPKKRADEQIVVLNHILDCKDTKGYDKHLRGIVKEVNGKPIINFRDLITAMEEFEGPRHVIVLSSKSRVVVPNMSKERHQELLKRYHISSSCSKDIQDFIDKLEKFEEPELQCPQPVSCSFLGLFGTSNRKEHHKVIAFSSSEEEMELSEGKMELSDEDLGITRDMLPGLKRYEASIGYLEEKYKNLPQEDDESSYVDSSDRSEYEEDFESESVSEEEARSSYRR